MSSQLWAAAAVLFVLLIGVLAWASNRQLRLAMAARGRSEADLLQERARVQRNAEYEQLRATLWRQRLQPGGTRCSDNDIYRLFENKDDPATAQGAHTEPSDARMPVTMRFQPRR
jgi:DNA/RNA-binding domain of Phe-tRNA-synthetase-like protein